MPYYPPRQEESQRRDSPRRHSAVRWILLCVSGALVLYGAYRLISYGTDMLSSWRTAQELREIVEDGQWTASIDVNPGEENNGDLSIENLTELPENIQPEQATQAMEEIRDQNAASEKLPPVTYPNGYEVVPSIRELRKKSENIIGWLKMDDLEEPVARKDNSFFLDHDAMGKRNVNGAIFMDEHTDLLTRPYTILLYGHNMKTGAMFGNLRKYETFSYCYQHRIIQFDTLYEEGEYVIFAAETISVTPGKSRYLNLAALQSLDRTTRKAALETLIQRSLYNMPLDVNEEDQLLILVTCVGEDDERLIVAARRLRTEESADRLISQ